MEQRTDDQAPAGNPPDPSLEDESTTPGNGEPLVSAELLIEDVSIDGMCGVY